MKNSTKIVLSFFPALVFIANELIRTYIRPLEAVQNNDTLRTVFGWLPNLLAGFGMMTFGIFLLTFEQLKIALTPKIKIFTLIGLAIIALAGLIWHEVTQKGTGLYYDINDIWATIAGVALGFAFCYAILVRRHNNQYDIPGEN